MKTYWISDATIAWEKQRNKFEPISVPTTIKLEKFRHSAFKKYLDLDI
jgi:hypothetical protein